MSNFPFWVSKGDGTRTWVDRGDNRVARAMPTLRVQVVVDEPTGNVALSKASGVQLEAQDQKVTGAAITVPKDSPPPGAVTLDRGDPGAVAVQKKFAGSLKQFYAGQAQIHARGGNAQTRTRTDRGDHQIEYLNQFGQEQVTLRVSESVYNSVQLEKSDPYDFLDVRVGLSDAFSELGIAFNTAFYVRELFDPNSTETVEDGRIFLPPGVSFSQEPFWVVAANPQLFWTESDNNIHRNYLDLRQFHPEAQVAVDIYIYHTHTADAVVGSRAVAMAWWWYNIFGSSPPNYPAHPPASFQPQRLSPIRYSGVNAATASEVLTEFPEYADLWVDIDTGSEYGSIVGVPGGVPDMLYWGFGGTYYNPSTGEYDVLSSPTTTTPEWIDWGNSYMPLGAETEYDESTGFRRRVKMADKYTNSIGGPTGAATLAVPPSAPSWLLVDFPTTDLYNADWRIAVNHILFLPETGDAPAPANFDISGLCHKGDGLPFDTPLPELASNRPVASQDGVTLPGGPTVANHFGGVHVGTIFADRKTGAIAISSPD